MNFGEVIQAAAEARRSTSARNGDNFYKTKFEPPKKETKSKTLSTNIQKFLAKKEEEERRKAEIARKKRDELLAMRDTKATNKIKKMLKVIKSANKSVLEDAIDNDNTAVTASGLEQPDEDDYGYVSQEASAFYSKMMEKYKKIPEEDKFSSNKKNMNSDLSGTKDRVRAAILREQEEEALPHKRKRKSNNHDHDEGNHSDNGDSNPKIQDKEDSKPKLKRPPAPPPMDFNQLLKIAEKKQFEPVMIEPKKIEKSNNEPERLMTKKQKKEFEEQKAFKEARLRREKERENAMSTKKDSSETTNQRYDPKSSVQKSNTSNSCSKPSNNISNLRIPKISDKHNVINNSVKVNSSSVSSMKGQFPKSGDLSNKKVVSNEISKNRTSDYTSRVAKPSEKSMNKSKNSVNDKSLKTSVNKFSKDQTNLREVSKNINISQSDTQRHGISSSSNMKVVKQNSTNAKTLTNGKIPNTVGKSPLNKSTLEKPVNKANPSSFQKVTPIDKKVQPGVVNNSVKNNLSTPVKNIAENRINKPVSSNLTKETRRFSPVDVKGSRQFPPADVRGSRQNPPADVKGSRQFPPADMRKARPIPPSSVKANKEKFSNKRRIIDDDDDSEYDSSLDDFIDDGPEEPENVSSIIKEIFGYDKSKYRDFDDDDRNMESNYSQVMREEYISKKIGIMEDLEDMRMEALEKKRKANKKRRRIS